MSSPNPTRSDPESEKPPPIIYQSQPFIPRPPITTEERVAVLTRVLDPNDSLYLPTQSKNIIALIDLYNKGIITVDDEVFVVDGRIASREECIAAKKPYFWEVSLI
jgi:hypothetical protein